MLLPIRSDLFTPRLISLLIIFSIAAPSEEIQQAVGRSHTTHRLALGAKTLSSSQIRPLFRALTHQTHITAIMISDNNVNDAGVKYLTECMCTMKHLTHLDISRNNITGEGTKFLLNLFEKSTRVPCQALEEIDISSNPISDEGFKNIVKICQYVRLKVLKMNYCNITEYAINESNKSNMNFDSLESIDVSNNALKQPFVACMMTSLNPNILVDLELDNVSVEGNVVGCIASFLDSAKDLKLRKMALSNCRLVDGQFMRIFRLVLFIFFLELIISCFLLQADSRKCFPRVSIFLQCCLPVE